ncbi:SDR family NAD(P)-dependent oxidoreductase [Oceanicoccus sp. KOV_DT_Chl]|uniref:SDR family NAD(P)-dependent oxidoreductase n=1 Tax=Oceanicoccus sp. KOV_DT_Chl TaxID=1904639 RepID=UPI000C7A6AA4|nr:SDR family NAD(P)-dependent oxidoreductase [Oceanicoccus sp. KOV_DT_Chl]
MKTFNNKVAVITGAASGIGLGLARHAAKLGMKLVIVDIEELPLTNAQRELEALGVEVLAMKTDVSDAEQMDQLANETIKRFGTVHLLFNNAGVGGGGAIWELDTDYWEWVLGVNLWGVIHGIRTFTKHMVAQKEGHIINTASIAGLMSAPSTGPYTVSKHAVVGLSETLFGDLRNAEANVGVSVLCPAFVDTKIYAAERNRPMDDALKNDPARIAEQQAIETMAADFFSTTLSPEAVAEQVFKAIVEGDFYILTHPKGSKVQIEKRMHSILQNGHPTATGPEDFPLE